MIEKISINEQDNEYYMTIDSRDGFLISLPEKCTFDDFLIAAKVESNSYSSILISRLFHGLLTSSINVNNEYNKYYSKEYEDLCSFLFWKYCVPINTTKKVLSELHEGEAVLYNTFSSGCSRTVNAFIEDPIMIESLNNIINEVRRMHHEN